ncbi:MAG: hypothetical protein LBM01_02290 [Christensenellaceae bacterium]|jgi:hypothetical protein|nr:hypothetical protein [Christensenellaceae bacterium]
MGKLFKSFVVVLAVVISVFSLSACSSPFVSASKPSVSVNTYTIKFYDEFYDKDEDVVKRTLLSAPETQEGKNPTYYSSTEPTPIWGAKGYEELPKTTAAPDGQIKYYTFDHWFEELTGTMSKMDNNGKLLNENTKATRDAEYTAVYTNEIYDIIKGTVETATCEEAGYRSTARYINRRNGYNPITIIETISTEPGSLPPHGHDFRPAIHWQSMTGSNYGYIQYVCAECGKTVSDYLDSDSEYLKAQIKNDENYTKQYLPYKDNFVNGINYYYELFDTPTTIQSKLLASVVPTLQKDTAALSIEEAEKKTLLWAMSNSGLEGDAHQTQSWADGWRVDDWADGYLWAGDATMDTNTKFTAADCADPEFYLKTEYWMSIQVYFKPEFEQETVNNRTFLKEVSYDSAISYYNGEVKECEDNLKKHAARMETVNAQTLKRIDKIDERLKKIPAEIAAAKTDTKKKSLEDEKTKLEAKRDSLEDKLDNPPKLVHYVARFGWYVVECEFYNIPSAQMSEFINAAIAATNTTSRDEKGNPKPSEVLAANNEVVVHEYDNR